MSERSHHHNPAAHSRSRPTREKGAVPFQLIGHHQLRTPRFHSPPCLGNGGSWIAGSRRLPLFPRKEGQARAELPHREPLTMHANRPLKDIACVLHAQTKDATVVCVIGCQITRTRIHTLPKRLASARHSRVRKLYSYQIHSARFKQTSQWRRKSWWCILPAALILWYAGSDVMGYRRPTGGVFSYVSSDRVTLRAFPVATPRGRSSSSHEGETQFSLTDTWYLINLQMCCKCGCVCLCACVCECKWVDVSKERMLKWLMSKVLDISDQRMNRIHYWITLLTADTKLISAYPTSDKKAFALSTFIKRRTDR